MLGAPGSGLQVLVPPAQLLDLVLPGPDLQSDGNSLQLPVVVLPAGAVVLPQVGPHPHPRLLQLLLVLQTLGVQRLPVLLLQVVGEAAGDDDHLDAGHPGGQHQAVVVGVHHHHHTDSPGGDAPAVLEHVLLGPGLGVLERQLEHLAEALAEVVTGGALDSSARHRYEGLHCGGVVSPGKLLLLCLLATDHGDGQQLLVDPPVEVQDGHHLLLGLIEGGEGSVALLPEELSSSEERLGVFELPSLKRKIFRIDIRRCCQCTATFYSPPRCSTGSA